MGHRVAAESLQAGAIRIETELTISNRHDSSGVSPSYIMARDQRVPVNARRTIRDRRAIRADEECSRKNRTDSS